MMNALLLLHPLKIDAPMPTDQASGKLAAVATTG
jgi:hypothetical protein